MKQKEYLNSTQIYKSETGMKHLNSFQKNKILKAKSSLLRLEKYFRELNNREIKIRKEIDDLFTKPVFLSRPGKLAYSPIGRYG